MTHTPNRLLLLLAGCAFCATAANIEFTYFYPDRYENSTAMEQWGPVHEWPLVSFPHHYHGDPEKKLDKTSGLIFWPGERITVHITGTSAPVDSVTCFHTGSPGESLPVAKGDNTTWTIETENRPDTDPLLEVYRVTAYSDGQPLASRGFILARAFGDVKHKDDPVWYRNRALFQEWCNAGHPYAMMTFNSGNLLKPGEPLEDHAFPVRNRPWHYLDCAGLNDIYQPRLAGGEFKDYKPTSNDYYTDPSMEWNYLWQYFGEGVGRWYGEFQWGPFSSNSMDNLDNAGLCYSDLKRPGTAYPNGLLFWQRQYYGLVKLSEMRILGRIRRDGIDAARRLIITASDGWAEGSMWMRRSLHNTFMEEVGAIPLYHRYCSHKGIDNSWASDGNSFYSFRRDAYKDYAANPVNDYVTGFMNNSLNLSSHTAWQLAPRDANRELYGDVPEYRGTGFNAVGSINKAGFSQLKDDFRTIRKPWVETFQTMIKIAGDYTHVGWLEAKDDFYDHNRAYRSFGMSAAAWASLFPTTYMATLDFRQCIDEQGSQYYGSAIPGTTIFDNNGSRFQRYSRWIDDGSSHRRMTMFMRLPMFYREGGRLQGYELGSCFGIKGYCPSDNPLWNTEMIQGMQLMEIPDRLRPIGGVLIHDSNNDADRAHNREFYRREFYRSGNPANYFSSMFDHLGIVTYANPDTEKDIPADTPRIYAPRKDGGDGWYCIAEVAGTKVRVPFDPKSDDQKSTSAVMKDFATRVRAAYPGGWPIQTTGGFAATAWESTRGVFVYVENPMESNHIDVARSGTVKLSIPGVQTSSAVYDLCGVAADPHRLDKPAMTVSDEWLTLHLDWDQGDARLFRVDVETATYGAPGFGTMGKRPGMTVQVAAGMLIVRNPFGRSVETRIIDCRGRTIERITGSDKRFRVPLQTVGRGVYLVSVYAGSNNAIQRVILK